MHPHNFLWLIETSLWVG